MWLGYWEDGGGGGGRDGVEDIVVKGGDMSRDERWSHQSVGWEWMVGMSALDEDKR